MLISTRESRESRGHWLISALLTLGLTLGLVGCGSGNNVTAGTPVTPNANPPAIGWDKSPNAVIFRLDRTLYGETVVNATNRLPLCTLYGNGHLVWVNIIPPNGEQVLETQLDDTAIRSFFDFLIRQQHFYSIIDYAAAQLPPNGQYEIETAVLNLNNAIRTIRSYAQWPHNEFQLMLDACTHLTKQPVLYVPAGAWMSVVPVVGASSDSPVNWSEHIPFRLSDLAASPNPLWLSGEVLGTLWLQLRRTVGAIRWQENDKSYKIMLQVPNISRDSPTAPLITPTPQGLITPPTSVPNATVTPRRINPTITPTTASGASS